MGERVWVPRDSSPPCILASCWKGHRTTRDGNRLLDVTRYKLDRGGKQVQGRQTQRCRGGKGVERAGRARRPRWRPGGPEALDMGGLLSLQGKLRHWGGWAGASPAISPRRGALVNGPWSLQQQSLDL